MEKTIEPFVSVVIPVFNDAKRLRRTLAALENQTYPAGRYEVIVVDNGSTDESPEVARAFAGVRLLYERERRSSPYSARNRGIEAASGEVIALLDATCVPVAGWIEEGVACLRAQQAELVGGAVDFELGEPPSCGEIYDSISNIKVKESIERRQVVPTANLFVRKQVFEDVGLFPEGIRSGGDMRWTKQATSRNYQLVYGRKAIVHKPARSLRALLKKQWRVAKGQPAIWQEEGEPSPFLRSLKTFVYPHGFDRITRRIEQRGRPYMHDYLFRLWLVSYAVKGAMFGGRMQALLCDALKRATRREDGASVSEAGQPVSQ